MTAQTDLQNAIIRRIEYDYMGGPVTAAKLFDESPEIHRLVKIVDFISPYEHFVAALKKLKRHGKVNKVADGWTTKGMQ